VSPIDWSELKRFETLGVGYRCGQSTHHLIKVMVQKIVVKHGEIEARDLLFKLAVTHHHDGQEIERSLRDQYGSLHACQDEESEDSDRVSNLIASVGGFKPVSSVGEEASSSAV
jgi:hypothetical protein